jgi:uncharacterized membrane protein YgcG
LRVDVSRLKAVANVALCAAALSLTALGGGCGRSPSAPADGEAAAPSQARPIASLPAQNTRPAPAPSPLVESPLPPPEGFVNDFADVIDAPTESLLEAKFERLRARARIEFAVVTIETTGEQEISDYSLALAKRWGVGPPAGEGGGGLLLLLAVKDHKWRLQVSRSLGADIPDDVAAEIGTVMKDSLRAGRYDEAVTRYADGLIRRLAERRGFSMQDEELTRKKREP